MEKQNYDSAAQILLEEASTHDSIGKNEDQWKSFNEKVKKRIGEISEDEYLSLCEKLQDENLLIGEGARNNRITTKGRELLRGGGYIVYQNGLRRKAYWEIWKFVIPMIISSGTVVFGIYLQFAKIIPLQERLEKIERIEIKTDSSNKVLQVLENQSIK